MQSWQLTPKGWWTWWVSTSEHASSFPSVHRCSILSFSGQMWTSGFSHMCQLDLKGPSSMSVVVNVAVGVCLYARGMGSAVEVKRPACPFISTSWVFGHTDVLNVLQSSLFSPGTLWKTLCPHLRGACCEVLCLFLWLSASFHPWALTVRQVDSPNWGIDCARGIGLLK